MNNAYHLFHVVKVQYKGEFSSQIDLGLWQDLSDRAKMHKQLKAHGFCRNMEA